ncbi:MAG: family 2 encapsulin nanocompartment cargo protein polyprenyl transferase [Pseudonocardiaceae bacterium]
MASIGVIATARSAGDTLAWSSNLLTPALRAAIDTLPTTIRHIAGYHFGWWDQHGQPTTTNGGKRIRPTLVLLAAEATGGDPTTALPAAVAIELIHNFSLLHDDVMDHDPTRRHRPTAWVIFGPGPAILTGDALLTLAYTTLLTSEHPAAHHSMHMLGTAVMDLISGQNTDLTFEERNDVTIAECIKMAHNKTAALLGCACTIGALHGEGSRGQVEHFRTFGEHLGLAFQHIDDLLGIWGNPATTGKPTYSDLRNHKKTLPIVAALTANTPPGHELTTLYHNNQPLTDTNLAYAAQLIDTAGGRTWSQTQAHNLLTQALNELKLAKPKTRPAAELGEVARLTVRRDH